jgi:hypothetical protein
MQMSSSQSSVYALDLMERAAIITAALALANRKLLAARSSTVSATVIRLQVKFIR